jgi:hypothetical protein
MYPPNTLFFKRREADPEIRNWMPQELDFSDDSEEEDEFAKVDIDQACNDIDNNIFNTGTELTAIQVIERGMLYDNTTRDWIRQYSARTQHSE